MKRRIFVKKTFAKFGKILICGAVMAAMCGCSAGLPFTAPKTADFDTRYSVNADITCGELEASAEIKRTGSGSWQFCFTEPKQLSGLTLSLNEDGLTAGLGALSFNVEPNEIYTMIPDIVSAAVDTLPEVQDGSLSEEDGIITLTTQFGEKPVTVTAAKDTGELISLKCPYYKLAVYFSGQTELVETVETEETVFITQDE